MKTIKQLLMDADPLRHEPAALPQRDLRRQAIVAAASGGAAVAGRARIRLARLGIMTIVVIGILVLGSRWWPSMVFESYAAVRFEVRLAEVGPAPGLREAKIAGTDRSVYLHEEVVVSNVDIARAEIIDGGVPSQFGVSVHFTAEGAEKMRVATQHHIGRPVAILVDDEVVVAPVLRAVIGASAVINGNYNRDQAERIVNGMLR